MTRTIAERYRLNAERMQTAARIVETVLDDLPPQDTGLVTLTSSILGACQTAGAHLTDASEEAPRG